MKRSTLTVVIVNWNTGSQLHECLQSIAASSRSDWHLDEVIVVDNASSDNSTDGISDIDLPLRVLRNTHNRGFSAACNQGARGCASDFLLFVNPDCRVDTDAISGMLAFMADDRNSRVGIAGPQLVDSNGMIARSCARFPTVRSLTGRATGLDHVLPRLFPRHFMKEWDHLSTRLVDQVMGACFLVRVELFEQLGGFDERFFVYFEELDLSFRAASRGWRSAYVTSARVFHKGGGSSEQAKPERLFYSLRSRLLYSFKQFGTAGGLFITVVTLFLEPPSRAILALIQRSPVRLAETFRAYVMLWSALPGVLRRALRDGK